MSRRLRLFHHTAHRSQNRGSLLTVALLTLLAPGCSFLDRRERITTFIQDQAAAWNEGNVDRFMSYYKRSDDLTFSSGGKTRRGWQATSDHFKSRYDTREKMGRLTFSELEVTPLGDAHSLVLGRWQLDRAQPIGGNFSLIIDESGGAGMRIIHDHTSVDATP